MGAKNMTGTYAYATTQGLGILAKQFYDNGIIDVVCVKDHSSRENHYEWYPNRVSEGELLEKCDTLIFFETCFNWKLIPMARERGIKTILIPMYECTRYPFPYEPDEVWTPSALDTQFYGDKVTRQIQIPVDMEWKQRQTCKTYVHNAGHGGLGGRNGTAELLNAMQYVKSPLKLIVRSQERITLPPSCKDDGRIQLEIGDADYTAMWQEGDCFVFPEKFNGLSLPIAEAFASGMLVMATDRFPNTTYLPTDCLIPVRSYKKERISVEFDSAVIHSEDIAACMDRWYDKDITKHSEMGKVFNEQASWKTQKQNLLSWL